MSELSDKDFQEVINMLQRKIKNTIKAKNSQKTTKKQTWTTNEEGVMKRNQKDIIELYNNQNKRLIVRLISSVKNTDEAVSDFGINKFIQMEQLIKQSKSNK